MQGALPVGAGIGFYIKRNSLALTFESTCPLPDAAPYSDYRVRCNQSYVLYRSASDQESGTLALINNNQILDILKQAENNTE